MLVEQREIPMAIKNCKPQIKHAMRSMVGALVCGLLGLPSAGGAIAIQDSWIFRSEVAPGQGVWGPNSNVSGHKFSDAIGVPDWVLGGWLKGTRIEYTVQADPGTVSGNVEGKVAATYDNHLASPGKTTIDLSYTGISNESRIGTSLAAVLSAKPRLKVDFPWWVHLIPPFPTDIDVSLPITFVDFSNEIGVDFTTGLDSRRFGSASEDIVPFNFDVVILALQANVVFEEDISFKPESIQGLLRYVHLESGTEKQALVAIDADGPLPIEVDLDKPGHWEFSLESFFVDENTFTHDPGFALELSAGVPILSAEVAWTTRLFDFGIFDSEFALDFLNHGYDGDATTVDRLGRFFIFVPEPGGTLLLAMGLFGLVGFGRRRHDSVGG